MLGCARTPGKLSPAGDGAASSPAPATPEVPSIEGVPWRIVRRPELGPYVSRRAEPVDFAIWQASDGTWQLVACVRGTTYPGATRLFYRWQASTLEETDWQEQGVFLTSDADPGYREGLMQAPHVVRDGARFLMYFNSDGAHVLESRDGKVFTPVRALDGGLRHFEMGRDVMVFDNRVRDGKVYAYYTAITPPLYPTRQSHTIGVRTAPGLLGPWSEQIDLGVNTADNPDPAEAPYNFINAESPFVLYRNGWYYRWEQLKVFASRDPLRWSGPEITTLAIRGAGTDPASPAHPRALYAPELVEHQGRHYVAGYKYREAWQGIYMARVAWR